MKKSKFTDSQIFAILREAEVGLAVPEVCRKHNISSGINGDQWGQDQWGQSH